MNKMENKSYYCPYCYAEKNTFIEMGFKGWRKRIKGEVKNFLCPRCNRETVSPLNEYGNETGSFNRERKYIEAGEVVFYDDPESPNMMKLDGILDRPMSIDEILDACRINRDIWMVADNPEVGNWSTSMKLTTRDDRGRIVEEKPHTERNWKLVIRLIYRNPRAVLPDIKPVNIQVINRDQSKIKRTQTDKKIQTALIAGDAHVGYNVKNEKGHLKYIPFHDRRALDIFLQIAETENPDYIVFGGDQLDNTNLSRFKKYPQYECLQAAIMEYSWFLGKLRSMCPYSNITEIRGNHDSRLEKAIVEQNLDAYKLNSVNSKEYIHDISHWCGFENMNIDYKNSMWLRDDWKIEHGSFGSSKPGATCSKHLSVNNINITFFHTHSKEYAEQTTEQRHGKHIIKANSPGCLCRIDGVIPGTEDQNRNWQNGIAVVQFSKDEDYPIQINQVDIKDGKTIYDGNIFEYRNSYLEQLRNETGWNF